MVDIHSHILPRIDDGSDSIEESISMLELALKWNMRHIVASSHGNLYEYSIEQYRLAFNVLQQEISKREIDVKIYPGMEIYLDENTPELLRQKKLLSINDTDYLLVEVPFEADYEYAYSKVAELMRMGYRIILAHPERYQFIRKDPSIAYRFVSKGCAMQVNTGSFLGAFGEESREAAVQLADMGLVHMLGTDAHDKNLRSYHIGKLLYYLQNEYTKEEVHMWLSENPSRVLKGMDLLSVKDIK